MRERLINLIDTYEKKLRMPLDKATIAYYRGKKSAYEHALVLLESYEEVI